jgi:hypothetical protein
MSLSVNFGTVDVDVPGCSSDIDLTVVGDKLVFSTNKVSFGNLKIPAGWLHMIEDEDQAQKLFFEVVKYTNTDEENDISYSVFHVYMFVLFDKGTMSGKIHITDDGIHVLSRGDWSEISFIHQEITQLDEAPMIKNNRVVHQIKEGTGEENGYSVAVLVMLEDKFIIFYTKLVFIQGTAKIEVKQIELPFPIQSFRQSITSAISFTTNDHSGYYCQYFTDFTIKIGAINYNVCMSFGAFNDYSVDHRDRHYTLSAIYNKETCTTIFCGNEDAVERMDHGMTRRGIFSIEIPEFDAPETDEYKYSELFDSLTHLPNDLQAFLRSITWCNHDA